jgi:tetratricopeptide (TPR) repeat protein/TolB-like protein
VVGETLSHYRIVERLGSGGMGDVYRAEDLQLRRLVAIKTLRDTAVAPHGAQRLLAEARAASTLNHPNIAVVYEASEVEHDGRRVNFIAMEHVDGTTLHALIGRGLLDLAQVLDIAEQTADALADAHDHGLVHRDVKPSNVMVTAAGRVKVLDFGVAQRRGGRVAAAGDSTHTAEWAEGATGFVGTLPYIAPEQATGRDVDGRADMFSLGVMLYELACGTPPFTGENPMQTLEAILRCDVPPLPGVDRDPRLPRIELVIRRMLTRDREGRFANLREVRDALAAIRLGERLPEALEAAGGAAGVLVARFQNISGNPEDEWLGAGMSETLATDVGQLEEISVIPRARVADVLKTFDLPHATDADEQVLLRAGRELRVRWMITGGFQRSGDAMRVTASLTEVASGRLVKLTKVDGTLTAIFTLQDRLARELLEALRGAAGTPEADEEPEVEVEAGAAAGAMAGARKATSRRTRMGSPSAAPSEEAATDSSADEEKEAEAGAAAGAEAADVGVSPDALSDAAARARQAALAKTKTGKPSERARAAGRAAASPVPSPGMTDASAYPVVTSAAAAAPAPETGVMAAYEAFSRGVLNLSAETFESLDRAVWLFERAVSLDPAYARAYVELGAAYSTKAEYLSMPELRGRAVASLRRAIELQPKSARAWRELGATLLTMGQVDDAVAAIRRALAIDPQDASAQGAMGRALFVGYARFEDAAGWFTCALERNAKAGWYALQLAHCAALLRDFPRGEQAARRAMELQEAFLSGREGLFIAGGYIRAGHLAALQGRHAEAIDYFQREIDFLLRTEHALRNRILVELNARLGSAHLHLGDARKAEAAFTVALDSFERRVRLGADDPFTRYYAASIHALRGDAEPALAFLERALSQQRAFTAARARIEPEFDALRTDPRFQRLVGSA